MRRMTLHAPKLVYGWSMKDTATLSMKMSTVTPVTPRLNDKNDTGQCCMKKVDVTLNMSIQ